MITHLKKLGSIKSKLPVILILLGLSEFSSVHAQDEVIYFNKKNAHEIFDILEEKLEVVFNYNYDLFDQSEVKSFSASGNKSDILKTCFTMLNKDYSFVENDLLIIKNSPLSTNKLVAPNTYRLRIVDDLKTELPYGIISLVGLDTHFETNIQGEFNLTGIYSDDQMLSFSYLGFEKKTARLGSLKADKLNTVSLKAQEHRLDEIVIKDKFLIFGDEDLAGDIISSKDYGLGSDMDNDVLSKSQGIAGVYNVTESLSDIQIRGGQPGQVNLQWNNIQLYQSSLFMGNVSSINPFMADVIRINKNGGSADDGSNASGSIQMQSDHYSKSGSTVKAYVDLLYYNIGASTSLFDNKLKIKTAYRHSLTGIYPSLYYDRLYENIFQFGPVANDRYWTDRRKQENPENQDIQEEELNDSDVNFGDFSISLMAKPFPRMTIDFNYLNVYNNFNYLELGDYEGLDGDYMKLRNDGLSSRLKYQLTPFWRSEFMYSNSNYGREYTGYTDRELLKEADYNLQDNFIHQQNFTLDQVFKINNHEWTIGVSYDDWAVDYIKSGLVNQEYTIHDEAYNQSSEKSIYLDYTVTVGDILKFRNGTRWSDYSLTHDNRIFIEPRIHISLMPLDGVVFHAHYGKYHKSLNRHYEYFPLEVENTFWYLSDEGIQIEDNWLFVVDESQYSAGVRYSKGNWSAELEAYKKNINNIWSSAFEFSGDENPWKYVNSNVSGLEFTFNYNNRWLSLSNTYELMDDDITVEDKVITFKNPYLQPFKTSINADLLFNKFRVSASWRYAKGRFFTEPTDIIELQNKSGGKEFDIEYGEITNNQIEDYHRLDLSVFYQLASKKRFKTTLAVSALNVYNQKNYTHSFYGIDWNQNPIEVTRFNKEGIPFMPNISLQFTFH